MAEVLNCGIDEVGRGCLAGPLYAAAALFRSDGAGTRCPIPGVRDSKKFARPEERVEVFNRIMAYPGLVSFGIGIVTVEEINQIGINQGNAIAFQRAVMDLEAMPDMLIVDGTFPVKGWPRNKQTVAPKADINFWECSAASIIAKVARDREMAYLHHQFPHYCWQYNAGYGTPEHLEGLKMHGATVHHRRKFIERIMHRIAEEKRQMTLPRVQ